MQRIIIISALSILFCSGVHSAADPIAKQMAPPASLAANTEPLQQNDTATTTSNPVQPVQPSGTTVPADKVTPHPDISTTTLNITGSTNTEKPVEPTKEITTPKNGTVPTTEATTTTQSSTVPITTTSTPSKAPVIPTGPTATPDKNRFDGPSFFGGIMLSLGLVAIGFLGLRYYKARTERNYHTL